MQYYSGNFKTLCRDFVLSEDDFAKKILIFPNGANTAVAELKQKHLPTSTWIAADPQYHLKMADLKSKMHEVLSPAVTKQFLHDYETQYPHGYYHSAALPQLPFAHFEFDLVLCPFLLFDNHLELTQQLTIAQELCRVAQEVRIYPVPQEPELIKHHLGPLMLYLQQHHFGIEIKSLEENSHSPALLRLWLNECRVVS